MSRAIESLWVGKTDNSAIPPRVKIRVFLLADGKCQNCKRFIAGKLTAEYDHVTALINGGENRESNLQLLCCECHRQKTSADVAEKSVTARVRAKHLGLKKPRTIRSWRRFDGSIVHASRERT
jgi:5-methylcytosine-specific restriction endonuclease McrA